MSLQTAISKGVAAAFLALDPILKTITLLHATGAPVRDPVTGTYTTPTTSYVGKGAVTEYSITEGRANLEQGDRRLIIRKATFPLVSIDDRLTIDAKTWKVVAADPDPADATWDIQIRQVPA